MFNGQKDKLAKAALDQVCAAIDDFNANCAHGVRVEYPSHLRVEYPDGDVRHLGIIGK